jgi:hypothetical protein
MDKYYPYEPLQFDNTNLTKKTLEIKPIYLMYSRLLFQFGNTLQVREERGLRQVLGIKKPLLQRLIWNYSDNTGFSALLSPVVKHLKLLLIG